VDLVEDSRDPRHPIPPEELRAFATDGDLPRDELNTKIDERFVPLAKVELPAAGGFDEWRLKLQTELRRVSFGHFPARIEPAARLGQPEKADGTMLVETEPGIKLPLQVPAATQGHQRVLLAVLSPDEAGATPAWLTQVRQPTDLVVPLETRGIGATRWTRKNPPNTIERSHVLLGRTVDAGRVWDVVAVARYLAAERRLPVHVAGKGHGGIIALYAAVLEPQVFGATLVDPPASHMERSAPQLLNVLRVLDIPEACGMLATRSLTIVGAPQPWHDRVAAIYAAAGAAERLLWRQ
jgi:hypothetical protein